MIFEDLSDFKEYICKGLRLIGLDIGRNTIGIALSDRDWNLATPKLTIKRKNINNDIKTILYYINDNNVCGIVSGLPLNSNENDTKSSMFIMNFLKILSKQINLPIYLNNEYLTSFVAEDFLTNYMFTDYKKTKEIVDKVAASYILQDVLNNLD